jgi:hypothetical protein
VPHPQLVPVAWEMGCPLPESPDDIQSRNGYRRPGIPSAVTRPSRVYTAADYPAPLHYADLRARARRTVTAASVNRCLHTERNHSSSAVHSDPGSAPQVRQCTNSMAYAAISALGTEY